MALKQASEVFTKFVHIENGNTMVRRVHQMQVQDRKGRLHFVKQDDMPECVIISTGQGMKGCHLAQILLSRNPAPEWTPDKTNTWGLGHFVTFCLGFLLLVMVRFIHGLFIECL